MNVDARARALRAQGDRAFAVGQLAEADAAYAEALALAEGPEVEGEIWVSWSWLRLRRDEQAAAEDALSAAISAFARASVPARHSAALQSRSSLRWSRAHEHLHGHSVHHNEHHIGHHGANPCGPAPGHDTKPHEAEIEQDLRGALADVDEAVRIAGAAGERRAEATALAARASLLRFAATERAHLVSDDATARARVDLDAAIDAFQVGADPTGAVLLCCAEVERNRRVGDGVEAWRHAERARTIAATAIPPIRARAELTVAELMIHDGRHDEAHAVASAAAVLLGSFPDPGLRRRLDALLSR